MALQSSYHVLNFSENGVCMHDGYWNGWELWWSYNIDADSALFCVTNTLFLE